MHINIIFLCLLIVLSAFFSAAETALFSLGTMRLRRLVEKNPRAATAQRLLNKPTHLLSTIVCGNMMVNVGITSLTTVIFVHWCGRPGILYSVLFSATAILLFGEIFPKTFAIYNAERFAVWCALPLDIFGKIFFPFIRLMEVVSSFFSLKFMPQRQDKGAGEEDLKGALLLGRQEGSISADEEKMIGQILEFKDTWAGEILTARIDMRGIDIKSSQKDVLDILKALKYSNLPVYENSLDNIVGLINAEKVFSNHPKDWRLSLCEPVFVPESKRIGELLKQFLDTGECVAVVLDEYGGTEGMVTLEDIEEEIFGEIYDEFEVPTHPVEKIGQERWRVYGKTALKTVNLELGCDIPEEENNIAAFLLAHMGRIPKMREKFIWNDLEFTIERASARRIISVFLEFKK